MYKYKTKDGNDVVIPNVGVTTNGMITTSHEIESPDLILVQDDNSPAPNNVHGTAPPSVQPVQVAPVIAQPEQTTNTGESN